MPASARPSTRPRPMPEGEGRPPAPNVQTPPILERRADTRIWIVNHDPPVPVWVSQCFPWSAPDRYLSLKNDVGEEIALVESSNSLDPTSRGALKQAMTEAGFLFEVSSVVSIEEEVEVRH